ncbi:MAG TPA: hypothetical protein VFL70_08610, partial [Bacteroidia bacterium]|nr:hypothetical protein [Bacteroidia bacterium]
DMSDFSYARKFDFIVLADILEHIPVELHSNIFKIIQKHTHADSLVVINIPHPDSIDWVRNHNPELLQIIDQALNAAELMHTIYSNNLCLVSFKSYSLFFKNYDYQFMVVKPRLSLKSHPIKSKFELLFEQLKYRILI